MRICVILMIAAAMAVPCSLGGEDVPAVQQDPPPSYPMMRPWAGYPPGGDTWAYVRDMQERINRIVEDSYRRFGPPPPPVVVPDAEFYPMADVHETDREFIVTCDLPGMEKDKIDISFKDGTLSISGKREIVKEQGSGTGFHVRERSSGSFERVIPIGTEVKESEIKADYKNGVLTVTLPKVEAATTPGRKIQIL